VSVQALTLIKSRVFGGVSEKAVALVLADYADDAWSCFPSQARIAAEAEVGERTVRRILAAFADRGLACREARYKDGHRTSDRIYLYPDAIEELPATVAATSIPANGASIPANHDSHTGQALAGEPLVEPSEEPTPPLPPKGGRSSSSPRAMGTNPRGPRPPDPIEAMQRAAAERAERNAARLEGRACGTCGGAAVIETPAGCVQCRECA
jgi:hypothetical protein